jgi:ribosome-binding factor A
MSKNKIVQRQEKQLLTFINDFLAEEITHSEIKTISVVAVNLTEDYSFVTFYYDAENHGEALEEALESIKNFTKKRMAEAVEMRRVPNIIFKLDDHLEKARGIDKIIDKIATKETEEKN